MLVVFGLDQKYRTAGILSFVLLAGCTVMIIFISKKVRTFLETFFGTSDIKEVVENSELNISDIILNSKASDTYYLEWKWISSDNDTEIGAFIPAFFLSTFSCVVKLLQ